MFFFCVFILLIERNRKACCSTEIWLVIIYLIENTHTIFLYIKKVSVYSSGRRPLDVYTILYPLDSIQEIQNKSYLPTWLYHFFFQWNKHTYLTYCTLCGWKIDEISIYMKSSTYLLLFFLHLIKWPYTLIGLST